ncbi:unnamed protein product [Oreochromis niloticus]|nr:unnamed protein product [Mustela putorius furo]
MREKRLFTLWKPTYNTLFPVIPGYWTLCICSYRISFSTSFTYTPPPTATARLLASTEDVPSEPPDKELPGPSEPSPRKKRCSRRRRGTPQPDVGTFQSAARLSAVQSAARLPGCPQFSRLPGCPAARSSVGCPAARLPAVQSAARLPAVQSAARLPGCPQFSRLPGCPQFSRLPGCPQFSRLPAVQSAARLPAVQSATPPPVTPPLSPSSLPVVQLPLVQQPTHSFIQSPSSPSHYEQGTHFIITSAGSLKLAFSETVAPSRASPEAGCQSPANSGPLEVKMPAPAAHPENSPEQSWLSAPPESSSEFTRPPPSSAECIGEHFHPSEDCIPLLLPESSHCAAQPQPVSTLPEVSVPAASVSVSTGGPEELVQSQATSAGGSGEPSQPQVLSAEGSGEPSQHLATSEVSSAGGPEESVQPQVSSAGGSGEPSQLPASLAGGSEEPVQHHAPSAGGPGGPSQHILMSAAVATPSWDPARPVPPRLCRPFSRPLSWHHGRRGRPPEIVRRRRWHRGRPPDLLSGRHCVPSGRPPD